ncbi:MAG: hypothetical protein IT445_20290 [Phycisphaeraceae bacterium]|nr:hypothetical protein [Phycisphaeraceae bacterium]
MPTLAPFIPSIAALSAQTQRQIFFYLGMIVIAAIVLVAVALVVRRLMLGRHEPGESFTLSDVRRLHQEGQLSDEEFEAARKRLIAQQRAAMNMAGDKKNLDPHADKDADADPPAGMSR